MDPSFVCLCHAYLKHADWYICKSLILSCRFAVCREHCQAYTSSIYISIYTLTDLGDLSNLTGSLSRAIQQYSPPSEWIMCEHVFFAIFLRERSFKDFKSRQNPRVDSFAGKKRLRRVQNGVFPFTVVEFCGRWIVYNSRLFA